MKYLFFIIVVFVCSYANAQSKDTAHLYNVNDDAEKEIAAAVKNTALHVFIFTQQFYFIWNFIGITPCRCWFFNSPVNSMTNI